MWPSRRLAAQSGQATVEWAGLICLASLAMLAFASMAVRVPVTDLLREIAERLVCAASLGERCEDPTELEDAYGPELAQLVRDHAPGLVYETGMSALPVDYRSCRTTTCSAGSGDGERRRSEEAEPVSAFVHVIDCRAGRLTPGADCSGDREGNLYLQYFFYYPDSATLRSLLGEAGYHKDDWESFGVRISPDGDADVRASSHHGYNYELGVANWGSDAALGPLNALSEAVGARPHGGWGPETGWLFVSGGSHAGNAKGDLRRIGSFTHARNVRLIPLEPLAAGSDGGGASFAIDPPWLKDVWSDPEAEGTD